MYGQAWRIPAPDLPNTDFIVVQGANPHASQGSLLACPDVLGELDKVRERGKVVVIDPRRTGTVKHADQWLPIYPGTDAALQLAVVQVLFEEGVNNNLLAPGTFVDVPSGNAAVNGIPVEVVPA